jgi:O-antigen/teichoic acid export membrane protein
MSIAKYIKQLGSETVVYGISGTLSRFINFFLVPLYTRVFTPADYGIIGILTSLLGLVATFIVLGLDNASARWFYDTQDTTKRQQVIGSWFWCQFIVGTSITSLLFIMAPFLATVLLDSDEYVIVLRLAILVIPLGVFGHVLGNWLRYQRRAWTTMMYFTSGSLATIGTIVLFVLVWRKGLVGLYQAKIIAGIAMAVIAIAILRTWIAPRNLSRSILKEMLKFGLPLIPAGIASWVTASSDRFFLNVFHSTAEVGIYIIAVSLASGVALVTSAFQMAWGPFAFSILQEPGAAKVYSKVLSLYGWLGCWFCTAVAVFAPVLLRVLTTPTYYSAATSIPWLAFSHLAIGGTYIAALGSSIVKKSAPVAASIFIGAGVNTILNFILIPPLGKDGAAIATLVAYTLATIYLFIVSQRNFFIPYRFRDVIVCFLLSWVFIGIDHFFLPAWSVLAFGIRVAMCASFIWVGFRLEIISTKHLLKAAAYIRHTLAGFFTRAKITVLGFFKGNERL